MCTAVSFTAGDHYFGRNLDFEHGFGEKITVTPRNYRFSFGDGTVLSDHFAIIGMALVYNGYPLYFDAVNECGLGAAGLNFPGYARYFKRADGRKNIASFELIPWILAQCSTVRAARELLSGVNITDDAFEKSLEPTPLHWMIADRDESLTLEQTEDGLHVYENPVGVLTNSPGFDFQLANLSSYMNITREEAANRFSDKIELTPYSRGMGGIGLPGDLSSMSRFVRACFVKLNSECEKNETDAVNQFFHILGSVSQQRGCARVGEGFEISRYSSCCNTDRGIYYYTSYNNSRVCAVDMHSEELDSEMLTTYDILAEADFYLQNKRPPS